VRSADARLYADEARTPQAAADGERRSTGKPDGGGGGARKPTPSSGGGHGITEWYGCRHVRKGIGKRMSLI